MKDRYRVVVIGGGIVGASVLYHLAEAGWTDTVLIERSELTAGSTWHAAAGFHGINEDASVAALQHYTIGKYAQVEAESGQSVGMHRTGGLELAGTRERWEWLQGESAVFRARGVDARLVGRDEIAELCPIVNLDSIAGALYDPTEGHLDPHGATHAYTIAARGRGAEVVLHNRVTGLSPRPAGGWQVHTELGDVEAEHVVNAAGLWGRRVARMAGVDLPLVPMQHHYLVTEDVPAIASLTEEMPAVTDLEGFTYLRQEHNAVLLGVYETDPRHWQTDGAPWDFGIELLPEQIDRITEELAVGFERFPALQDVGIRRWVNGALMFTPDGNPLIGPVPGLRNYWVAGGTMAGFSQCGAMGLALAQWMVHGDPGADVFGMDVARYGPFACNSRFLEQTTRQFYARRFVLPYPNETLPAGRPLKVSACHDLLSAQGARFDADWGLEVPLYFADDPDFVETPALRRSAAESFVRAEAAAVRKAAGVLDTAALARYEVSGPAAAEWLDKTFAGEMPAVGQTRTAPLLNDNGHLIGLFTLGRLDELTYWLTTSYHMQQWHMRWFQDHLPVAGATLHNVTDDRAGVLVCGPQARTIVSALTTADLTTLPPSGCARTDVGLSAAVMRRGSITGEDAYELTVPGREQRSLYRALCESGADLGLRPFGVRALDSLRLEKAVGVWGVDFAQDSSPVSARLDRFVDYDKPKFVGRDAALRELDRPPARRLMLLEVAADDADAVGAEPVSLGDRVVGVVTSGGYGHTVGASLALAYIDADVPRDAPLSVHVLGAPRAGRILPAAPYDPAGERLRD